MYFVIEMINEFAGLIIALISTQFELFLDISDNEALSFIFMIVH